MEDASQQISLNDRHQNNNGNYEDNGQSENPQVYNPSVDVRLERAPAPMYYEYQLLEQIGQGQFGTVYRAVEPLTGRILACKQMSLRILRDSSALEDLRCEIRHLKKARHPNIVNLVDEKKTADNHYLFFELCNGGMLSDIKSFTDSLNEGTVREIGLQMLTGLRHLHSLKIIHRDLKNDNILLHFPDLEKELQFNPAMSRVLKKKRMLELLYQKKFVVKIADLGFSKQLQNLEDEVNTYCGTPLCMAPEVMNGMPYTYKADIWSVGVNLFQLLTGVFPFFARNKPELLHNIQQGLFLLYRHITCSPIALDFINKCLQYEQSKRFTWAQIEAHPFFKHKEYYRVLERISFAMNIENDGQNVRLQEMPNRVISNFHNSRQVALPPNETPMIANPGIENRRNIKMNVQRELNKSDHFLQSNQVNLGNPSAALQVQGNISQIMQMGPGGGQNNNNHQRDISISEHQLSDFILDIHNSAMVLISE